MSTLPQFPLTDDHEADQNEPAPYIPSDEDWEDYCRWTRRIDDDVVTDLLVDALYWHRQFDQFFAMCDAQDASNLLRPTDAELSQITAFGTV